MESLLESTCVKLLNHQNLIIMPLVFDQLSYRARHSLVRPYLNCNFNISVALSDFVMQLPFLGFEWSAKVQQLYLIHGNIVLCVGHSQIGHRSNMGIYV